MQPASSSPELQGKLTTASRDQAPDPARRNHRDAALEILLSIEADVRMAENLDDLALLIANESRKLTGARQIFVLAYDGKQRISAISGLPHVQRHAPLVQDMELLLNAETDPENGEPCLMDVTGYPFPYLLWQPFLDRSGQPLGGMLLARETPWQESDLAIIARLSDIFAHAWQGLLKSPSFSVGHIASVLKNSKLWMAAFAVALLAMALPVQMSVLAPMEVVARDAYMVSAPLEGAIEEVLVEPGQQLQKDAPLVRFSDTVLRNKLDVAQREVMVAEARLKKANQMAFSSQDGRQELRLAMADLDLKRAQWKFASDMFARTIITAPRAGIAVFADKQSLAGKPVVVGERILQIANPADVEIRIEVPVSDALILKQGAEVKLYLDSDPVNAQMARLRSSDYQAQKTSSDGLAFHAIAEFATPPKSPPRLGVRGTAQIYGEDSYLGLYLFRRPLSALRQFVGL